MPQEPVNQVNTVNPVIRSLTSSPFPSKPDQTPELPGEAPLVSQIRPREHRPPPPARVLPDTPHSTPDDLTDSAFHHPRRPPTSGEVALSIIVLSAALGFIIAVVWFAYFYRP